MRPMDGISTVHALGINYNDAWGEALQVSASYLFNHTGNENRRHSERRNFTSTDRLVLHDERGETTALDKITDSDPGLHIKSRPLTRF